MIGPSEIKLQLSPQAPVAESSHEIKTEERVKEYLAHQSKEEAPLL